jgi:hypothetical protein
MASSTSDAMQEWFARHASSRARLGGRGTGDGSFLTR